MYKIEYLPLAAQDLVDIAAYINQKLCNPQAAEALANLLIKEIDNLSSFPYLHELYISSYPLKHEYRKLTVKNYLVFYWIDEAKKLVTISRVLYGKRDYNTLLK